MARHREVRDRILVHMDGTEHKGRFVYGRQGVRVEGDMTDLWIPYCNIQRVQTYYVWIEEEDTEPCQV